MQKASQKLNALSQIAFCMPFDQRRLILNSFITSHFSYCLIVWMFHSRNLNETINHIHERALRIVYKDVKSSFKGFQENSHSENSHPSNLPPGEFHPPSPHPFPAGNFPPGRFPFMLLNIPPGFFYFFGFSLSSPLSLILLKRLFCNSMF